MRTLSSLMAVCVLAVVISGCAGVLGSSRIADLQRNAGHYADRTVSINGTVTDSWGLPLLPYKYYKVSDGTGEMMVLSQHGNRIPVKGSHVSVRGVVKDVAVFSGQPLGLHLEERSLDVKGN
ncbi:MAG TPA: hypothetical protein VGZ27_12630 [Vicinamibacterales bacterium]|jgi:hypothetical protein|nr:hypothetical protein [Vicinamibacterales bacterium]